MHNQKFRNYLWSVLSHFKGWIPIVSIYKTSHQKVIIRSSSKIDESSRRLESSWQEKNIPAIQRELVNRQIQDFRDGKPIDVFDSLVQELRLIQREAIDNILEIGCSSGYYSEVFKLAEIDIKYSGCDYSIPFIEMAKYYYPSGNFYVADARSLPFDTSSFDIVISGCCILHIREYEIAIQEAARVAIKYVLFHRTPVLINQNTTFYLKQAYGVEMLEIHFNESELHQIFLKNNLRLTKTITIDHQYNSRGELISASRLYICAKNE